MNQRLGAELWISTKITRPLERSKIHPARSPIFAISGIPARAYAASSRKRAAIMAKRLRLRHGAKESPPSCMSRVEIAPRRTWPCALGAAGRARRPISIKARPVSRPTGRRRRGLHFVPSFHERLVAGVAAHHSYESYCERWTKWM